MQSSNDVIADKPGLNVPLRPNGFHEHLWPAIDQATTPFPEMDVMAAGIQRDLDPALTIVGPTPLGGTIGQGGICLPPTNILTVRMDTRGTGHAWPTGAAQDRRAWLEVIAYDAMNNVVFSSGVVPPDKDPEAISDPNLVGFWDRTMQTDGTPAHFFWDVASEQSQLLKPPITLDQNSPAFDHSTTAMFGLGAIATQIDHITARVRIRPFNYAQLQLLVQSGDLDASIAASITTLDIAGSLRHWTRSLANANVPFSGCVADPFF
jgi:hypothetical protein